MKSPVIDQKSFVASPSSSVGSSWRGFLKRVRLILLEELLVPLLVLDDPWSRWMVSDVDVLKGFWQFHLRLGKYICNCHLSSALTLPLHWAFWRGFLMRPSPPTLRYLRPRCLLSRFPPRTIHTQGIYLARLLDRIDVVSIGLPQKWSDNRQLLQTGKPGRHMDSEKPFMVCLPIRQEILNVSQIAVTFQESAHHFSSRPDCNSTADVPSLILRTALSAITFVSDLCGVDVQWCQDHSSQDLPNSKELSLASSFLFPAKLSFYIGRIVSSASSARSPRYLRPQTDIAIPVFREMSKDVVFTRYHFCSRLQR